ncbi:MAG: S41 family peptidase [Verrucomicrobiales bacterium]|nr:S41 family peptidase [Verrucomicrobiales bacterium]
MSRRLIFGGLTLLLLAHLGTGVRLYFGEAHAAERDDAYPQLALFSRVLQLIKKDYVDGGDLTYKELVSAAVRGMLDSLDPHSEFLEPDKYDELKTDTEGEFGGLGVTVSPHDGRINIVDVVEETPGARAGLQPGDQLVAVEGESVKNWAVGDVVGRLRGKPGTEVAITTFRPSTGQTNDHRLTRAVIPIHTIRDLNWRRQFPLLEDGIGYVQITQFGEKTSGELDSALEKMAAAGMKGLVIDLRDNPGGLLEAAVRVCDKFVKRNDLVVSTEGRNGAQQAEFRATGRGKYQKLRLSVLVNGGSASASEIVAGCLQDLKRARVFGEQTFGKGSVQSILPLQDGTALRLTTAKYYTPSHKVIHEYGITPDSVVDMTEDEERDLLLRRQPGGLEALDEAGRARAREVKDLPLERAVDYLRGLRILAGDVPSRA